MTQLYEMQHKGFTFFNVVVPNTNRFQSLGSYISPYVALHYPQKDYDKIFTRSKFLDNGSCLSLSLSLIPAVNRHVTELNEQPPKT